jgi:hypothetical protein
MTPPDRPTEYKADLDRAVGVVSAWLSKLIEPSQVVELRALRVTDGSKGGSTWAGTFRGDELRTWPATR